MKSCPKCNRTFPDETQKFCTFDGGLLISSQPFDPNATVRTTPEELATPPPAAPPPPSYPQHDETSRDLTSEFETVLNHRASETISTTRDTAPTAAQTMIGMESSVPSQPPAPPPSTPPPSVPPPPAIPPPPPVVPAPPVVAEPPPPPPTSTSGQLERAPETVIGITPPAVAAPKKKSKMPLIIGGLLVLLVLGAGALAAGFFFVVKPWMAERNAQRTAREDAPIVDTNKNSNTANAATPTPEPSPSVAEYVAPPGTVQFVNSKDNLDGKLAEHYVDFSFYYPQGWTKDPKAGVAGAGNFARVERYLPPDFAHGGQEAFAVSWYTSAGSFVSDLPNFPKRAADISALLAKAYPEYEKVSEGPTKINSMDAYEFRWKGLSKGTEKGDIQLWGRVVFLPTGNEGDTSGATLLMFATSLAGELSSAEDVGARGEMPVILDSFRFGKKQ